MSLLQLMKDQRFSVRKYKEQMMLEAAELGLGTTWIGGFNHQKARELFGIPDYLVPVVLLPIGYPADDVKPSTLHYERFDMDHSVFYNSFDGIIEGESHPFRRIQGER